jgi:hypothetical protein
MGGKLGFSHQGKNIDAGCSRTGCWRRLHEEFHNLYASPHIIRVIKSNRMTWVGHIPCMGEMRNAYKILVRKP